MTEKSFDLAIIGGGPGGYVAAIKAAQLGLSVCLIEKDALGGVCLNWGCIPSKSMIHQASAFAALPEMEALGLRIDRSNFSYARVHAKSREAANALAGGVAGLIRKHKVQIFKATGTLNSVGKITLSGSDHDGETVEAAKIIIATGSRPMVVPGFEFDEQSVLSSTGLLMLTELPKSLIIIGGGAIGCEFAYVLKAFGVEVTLLEVAPQLLPLSDPEVAKLLADSFERRGINVRTGVGARTLTHKADAVTVGIGEGESTEMITAEKVLAAFGRTPNTAGLGLEAVGIELGARGHILTGAYGETSVPGIYAIGDVTLGPALAHVASREAILAVNHIAGVAGAEAIDELLVPSVVYSEPQVAGFGLTETQCKERELQFKKSVFPLRGTGKAVAVGNTEGFVKILVDTGTGEILGAHIVGAEASELIHELLLARTSELVVEDIEAMVHAHPTLSEAIMEAASGVFGHAIHV